ncbi:glycosyltransferase [Flavobacterium gyeonganense]|uniref:Glycosyltransferase n=1 Tax=Flavobacterium gyeonganense TaxID=1310418 RepID=A0ABV5H7Y1_9FLAO|nr:glycosyltransferase family 2 protein [Flavobacterium gyeonganense]
MKISSSIVLYNNKKNEVSRTIKSIFEKEISLHLFLIDNSLNRDLEVLKDININIEYIHNPSNPGFGAAHNIGIEKAIQMGSEYHFIINPDIYFTVNVIESMANYMKNNSTVGMMMPQILNVDGTIQNLPKLLPSPWSIILRKLSKNTVLYQKFINNYELREAQSKIYNAPVLSGCFTLLNMEAIKKIGMYDSKFFMYFEDWDLSRRMHKNYKTVYYPSVSVFHGYNSGANKSLKLFVVYITSAIIYFNKWGWFFDKNRKEINKKALLQFQ